MSFKKVPASTVSQRTTNPIRKIVDQLKIPHNPDLALIPLSIGDPTVFGNLRVDSGVEDELARVMREGKHNGYPHSAGYPDSRKAIAEAFTTPESPLGEDDVVIASGCSGAIELAIGALGNEGQNILVPQPGFSLYGTVAGSKGIECRYYRLDPTKSWEVDLEHLESLADENTCAVLVNNPSNPCGSVYSREHLTAIVAVCEKLQLPIIGDEIYADMTFGGREFVPIASVSKNVPVLTMGGLAKRFLVPGWRVGWILIHDRHNAFEDVRKGLLALTTLILGANSLAQATIPYALHKTRKEFHTETLKQLEDNAQAVIDGLTNVDGLNVIIPQGAMYVMVGVEMDKMKDIETDIQFARMLLEQKSVFVLPSQIFGIANFFRIVFCAPKEKLVEACARITEFVAEHHV